RGLSERVGQLGGRAPAVQVPDMLPADDPRFVGRRQEISQLLALLGSPPEPNRSTPRVASLVGPTGSGKKALAFHGAHRLPDAYPDGTLHSQLGPLGPLSDAEGRDLLTRLLSPERARQVGGLPAGRLALLPIAVRLLARDALDRRDASLDAVAEDWARRRGEDLRVALELGYEH